MCERIKKQQMNKSGENTTQPKRVGCQEAKELKEREKNWAFFPQKTGSTLSQVLKGKRE